MAKKYGKHRDGRLLIPQDGEAMTLCGRPAGTTRIEAWTANTTDERAVRWHTGNRDGVDEWPTREYLLDCAPEDRFADVGDTVEFLKLYRTTVAYCGVTREHVRCARVGSITL